MTYRGKVTKAGTVVLDDPKALPRGTVVSVRPLKADGAQAGIMKYAGKAKGLPRDASRNVDHYLYGHPKK